MRRYRFRFLVALAILASSCATTGIPGRLTSDDCLVLIRTTLENKGGAPLARDYYMLFSGMEKGIKVSNKADDFVFLVVREPGTKLERLSSSIDRNTAVTGDSFDIPVDIDLPYKPGKVVAADFTFAQLLETTGSNSYRSSFDFIETTADRKAELIERFRKVEGSEAWKE